MFWIDLVDDSSRMAYEVARKRYEEADKRTEEIFDHLAGVHGAQGHVSWLVVDERYKYICPVCGIIHEDAWQHFIELTQVKLKWARAARNAYSTYVQAAMDFLARVEGFKA